MEIRLFGEVSRLQVRRLIMPVIKKPAEEQHVVGDVGLEVQLVRISSTFETLRGKPKRTGLIEIHADAGGEDRSALAITKVLAKNGFHVRIHWGEGRSPDEYGPENDFIPNEYEG